MQDLSLPMALKIAGELGPAPTPTWLDDATACIEVVQLAQAKAAPRFVQLEPMPLEECFHRLDAAFTDWAVDPASAPGVDGASERKNVVLRLWSGCVWTGKMLAPGTRGGRPTTPEERAGFFVDWVNAWAPGCKVYKAGALHAAAWKKFLHEEVVLAGVPEPWKSHYERS